MNILISESSRHRGLTLIELAIENSRGLIGGNKSNMYSLGILADRNSVSTSWMVRLVRKQYSYRSSCIREEFDKEMPER
jgi:hypothetical protein